jgi:hypothetical protein
MRLLHEQDVQDTVLAISYSLNVEIRKKNTPNYQTQNF